MVQQKRRIRLVYNIIPSGIHDASWMSHPRPQTLSTDVNHLISNATIAERAKLDAVFLADTAGGISTSEPYVRPWRALDPIVVSTALALNTSRIGLVPTISAVVDAPFRVARQIASLQHVSRGRIGWNIITSQNPNANEILGISDTLPQSERYAAAEEFVTIVHQLWASLGQSAVIADKETGTYLDIRKARPIEVSGRHFSSKGVFLVPRYERGRPVIFQAGASKESHGFGGKWADALYTAPRTIEAGQYFSASVRSAAKQHGRDPEQLFVLSGILPILGSTEEEAHRKKNEMDEKLNVRLLLHVLAAQLGVKVDDLDLSKELPYGKINANDGTPHELAYRMNLVNEAKSRSLTTKQVIFSNIRAGNRVVVGTPDQIADDFETWVDACACDGFAFNVDDAPSGIETITSELVPELVKRKRFRREYPAETFIDNLRSEQI